MMHIQGWNRASRLSEPMVLLVGTVFASLVLAINSAGAQGLAPSNPSVGGTGGMSPPVQQPRLYSSANPPAQVHRGPTGQPCLKITGFAQQQTINPNIYDHILDVSNDCSQPIKLQACYYQSQQCTAIDVPGYGRKQATLGIMPAMRDFRFEYKEQFDQGSVFGGAGMRLF
jgi:hypothetical protein